MSIETLTSRGIGGHTKPVRGAKDEWLTPPSIINALGPFDLDPCSPISRPWPTATHHMTIDDDGLSSAWPDDAFVWCNPPYGQETWRWLEKLSAHPSGGVALVFARTETAWFFAQVWRKASALLFLEGRLHFHHVDGSRAAGNAGGPSVLVAYGERATDRLQSSSIKGKLVILPPEVTA